jgi:hypothetical protein
LDWLASDQAGHVALFSTGGNGPVPQVVADHLADVQTAIKQLSTLPILGPCAESPSGGGNFESWIEPCRRGLFGFDWGPVPVGPYARITVPSRILMVHDIADEALRSTAMLVQLLVDFSRVSELDQSQLRVELYRG